MILDLAQAIDGWMAQDELEWVATQATQNHFILELGSYRGRSTRAFADNCPGCVWAVEINVTDAYRANVKDLVDSGKLVIIEGNSLEMAQRFADEGLQFDLIFIDDEHFLEHVRQEIPLYKPLVRPGGILAGHDYLAPEHPGVTQAVNEAFNGTHNRAGFSIWWVQL